MSVRITIEHGNADALHWDYFYAEITDSENPDGAKILASASGDIGFIGRVVAGWLREYQPLREYQT